MSFIGGLFDSNEGELRKLRKIAARVNQLEPELQKRSDAELAESGIVKLITTDTVPLRPSALNTGKIEALTVAPLFAEAIRRIHEGESVGALFNPPGLQLPLQVT